MNLIALGLGSIRSRDSSRFRVQLFAALAAGRPIIKIANRLFLVPRFRPVISAALILHSLRRVFQIRLDLTGKPTSEIAVYHYLNEQRAIERSAPTGDRARRDAIFYSGTPSLAGLRAFRPPRLGKIIQWARVSMRLLEKNGFLIGARQAEFIALYGLFRGFFSRNKIRGRSFISTSESNPEIISAVLAAKSCGNKTVYVNHSALELELGTFFHDEIRLPGSAYSARVRPHLTRQSSGPRWIIQGTPVAGPPGLPDFGSVHKIGIACSIITAPDRLKKTVEGCLRQFPGAEVVVRLHPNRILSRGFQHWLSASPRVRISSRKNPAPLSTEAKDWDFAILGNSSAHLDLLALGVPTAYLNIDGIEGDLYGFLESGLVPAAREISELCDKMSLVYSRADWTSIYSRFNSPALPS